MTRRRTRPTAIRRMLAGVAAFALVLLTASPSFAAPALTVSATENLTDGQTLTISGAGFDANLASIAIGQCIKGYVGPADCNTSGGATFKNADASGKVAAFTIVVKEKFGSHDCTVEQCVVAGSPLPTGNTPEKVKANTYVVDIYFGKPAPVAAAPTTAAAAPAAPVATTAATTASVTVAGPVTATDSNGAVGFLLLGAGALIAGGVGIMLILQQRRGRSGGTA